MKKKKLVIILASIVILLIICTGAFFTLTVEKTSSPDSGSSTSSSSITSNRTYQPPRIEPLTNVEREKVINVIEAIEFIDDIPEDYPISIQFFYFNNSQRIWQDKFLIGNTGIVTSGSASIKLTLHSKYINEFSEDNFCEVIRSANENRDLGFESSDSEIKLAWKYKNLLSHKDCLGL